MNGPSTRSARTATGRSHAEWRDALDAAGAASWDHRRLVDHLRAEHPELNAWWRETVARAYERARRAAIGLAG